MEYKRMGVALLMLLMMVSGALGMSENRASKLCDEYNAVGKSCAYGELGANGFEIDGFVGLTVNQWTIKLVETGEDFDSVVNTNIDNRRVIIKQTGVKALNGFETKIYKITVGDKVEKDKQTLHDEVYNEEYVSAARSVEGRQLAYILTDYFNTANEPKTIDFVNPKDEVTCKGCERSKGSIVGVVTRSPTQ